MRQRPFSSLMLGVSFVVALSLGVGFFERAQAQAPAVSTDPLVPVSKAEDARVGPLAMATVITSSLAETSAFYVDGMDMNVTRQLVRGRQALALARDYKLPPQSQFAVGIYSRAGVSDATRIRAIEVTSPLAAARPAHDAQYVGPLSFGFPVRGVEQREAKLASIGKPATAGITVLALRRTDGSPYDVKEAHFKGPDGILSLGIDRADMTPVGPISTTTQIGGPAYSGMIVSDTTAMNVFLGDVLGFERRRDVELSSSGPNGGLGLPAGARFNFQQWFAPGSGTGYLVVMKYLNVGKPAPQPLGGPALGLARYSFMTRDLNAVMARARTHNIAIIQPARTRDELGFGRVRSAVLASPDNIPFEIIEAGVR
jgi:catechol 2,3-dioxygenase-like lactoylglutathione lyase family enzyme